MRKKRPRHKPTYYTVWALPDGTITAVLPNGRKPHPKSLRYSGPIDPDGICEEFLGFHDYYTLKDREWTANQVTTSVALNTRRTIRAMVLPRLEEIEKRLDAIQRAVGASTRP